MEVLGLQNKTDNFIGLETMKGVFKVIHRYKMAVFYPGIQKCLNLC